MSNMINKFISHIKKGLELKAEVVFHKIIPEQDATYCEIKEYPEPIINLLNELGIKRLYQHQKKAIDYIRKGQHIVIATPTASGKSLIYNIPVIESIIQDNNSKALYLFPLKALEQDQAQSLGKYFDIIDKTIGQKPSLAIFDGDTPSYKRSKIKKTPPNILITNPEMLHLSILPYHNSWFKFLIDLKFVVVDEVHTYRGVLGSNMAWVFRRFNRICNYYGTYPTFIFCSATIGNPEELTKELTGLNIIGIRRATSGMGKRHFIFVNPFLEGPVRSTLFILKKAISMELRTIVYTQSRKMTELISIWLESSVPNKRDKIAVYRAGFLPEERREIERKLNQKELLVVVSTSALELGIDIGALDVCVLVGYPGSIMASWQRAGRVGRRQQESVVIMVAQQDSLDQYFMRNPMKFFESPPENAVINPFNPVIMEKHLLCAVSDLPISKEENLYKEPSVNRIFNKLVRNSMVWESHDGNTFYPRNKRIHNEVSLRGIGREFIIVDKNNQTPIGTINSYRAYHETHKDAVYIHNKETFVVEEFKKEEGIVWVIRKNVKYYTRVRTVKDTRILSIKEEFEAQDVKVCLGDIKIYEKILGFEKIWAGGNRRTQFILFKEPICLEFDTCGMWIELPLELKDDIEKKKLHFMGGIHAVEHVLIGVLPLVILTDRNDLGGISIPMHEQTKRPAIFIYDGYQGGIGLTKEAFDKFDEVVKNGIDAISSCSCENGCPSCIQSPKCGAGNRPLDKKASYIILSHIVDAITHGIKIQSSTNKFKEVASPTIIEKPSLPYFGVFDIETQLSAQEVGGWNKANKMRVSYLVLYDSKQDKYLHFLEKDLDIFFKILFKYELIVGFNIIKFDYNVLRGYKDPGFNSLHTLDILVEVYKKLNFRISLNNLAKATLNIEKKGDGLDALRWWRSRNLKKLGEYCEEDVRITKDLFLFGHRNGYLLFKNKAHKLVKVYVDW